MTQPSKNQTAATLTELREASLRSFSRQLLTKMTVGNEFSQPPAAIIINDILSAIEGTASSLITEAFALLPPSPSNAPEITLAVTQLLGELYLKANSFAFQRHLATFGAFDHYQKSEVRDRLDRLLALHCDAAANTLRDDNAPSYKKRGPKGKHDWPAGERKVWARIYRGELQPITQNEIEIALSEALSEGGRQGPEPSNCRAHARLIWQAYKHDPMDNI